MKVVGIIFCMAAAVVLAAGCAGGGGSGSRAGTGVPLYTPVHAEGFEILRSGEHSSVIKIKDPWQGARNVNRYVFISRGGELPPEGFEGVALADTVSRIACLSSSHVAFAHALGLADAVVAVSGLRYTTNQVIRERAEAGLVRDIGYEGNINYELLTVLRPDVVFMYSVAGERLPALDKMGELGIPVVAIGEYLESTPLGKAEWIVAFGEIFGCRERAQEIFGEVSARYAAAVELARDVSVRPGVMLNAPWRDTWFVPGDRSYMVRLIRDAGAGYVCEGVDSEQSRAINGETAYLYAMKADFWLNPNEASSIAELLQANPRFADVPAAINGRVYNNTLRSTPEGGSDFWESGAVRPDLVLEDLIHVFHPELLPDHEPVYYKKLD